MDVWFCCISIHRVLIIYRINITADCFATHATCDVIDVLLRYENTKVKDLIKLCHLCFFRFCKLLLLQSLSVFFFYWSLLVHSKTFISSEIKLFLIIPLQNQQHVFVSWICWLTECKSNVNKLNLWESLNAPERPKYASRLDIQDRCQYLHAWSQSLVISSVFSIKITNVHL